MIGALLLSCSVAITVITPTPAPAIEAAWDRVTAVYGSCLEPVTVVVMDQVENLWPDAEPATVGGFYWIATRTIYVESLHYTPVLMHEFGHHVDHSCGSGDGGEGFAWGFYRRMRLSRPTVCRL